jgi:hypothetical protein
MIRSKTDGQGMQLMWERCEDEVFVKKPQGKELLGRPSNKGNGNALP